MPVSRESRLAQAIDAFREWLPTVRVRFNEWFYACREEPVLIWHTPAIRYTTYVLVAFISAWLISYTVDLFAPGGPSPQPRARTADFHVVCTGCGHHFVINRKFSFDDFPVKCPKCGKLTGQPAMQCFSDRCKGRWVAVERRDDALVCSRCGAVLGHTD
jgi:ribosomal protein S27E